jgi:alginate O-acetyltransferase complex protein AlgI
MNVGLLAYFKYANFFVDNLNAFTERLGWERLPWEEIMLPIGISFFTFQKLSYLIDLYYGKAKPLQRLKDYLLYILLFPQLIAGPIIRFKEIAAQLRDRRAMLTADYRLNGLFRFTLGLAKKVFIADTLGYWVDQAFGAPFATLGAADAWILLVAYAMQIYYDFSGYSDMAIGIGLVLGFRFPENFNFPYISRSITEFWRRWHITLGRWMRDYLYIPLGGNRLGEGRTYLNLWLVFLLSGLWHGAAWNFVCWGVFHGLFLVLDRLFLQKVLDRTGPWFALLFTFVLTLLGWVIFRAENMEQAFDFYARLFTGQAGSLAYDIQFKWTLLLAAFLALLPAFLPIEQSVNAYLNRTDWRSLRWKSLATLVLLILCMSEVEVSTFNPFIYFRF